MLYIQANLNRHINQCKYNWIFMKCYSLAFWAGMETAVTLKLFQSAKSAVWKGKCMGKKNESLYN